MKVIVISSPDKTHTEINVLIRLFESGLTHFHLQKPKWSAASIEKYIRQIPVRFHQHIILHSHHHLAIKFGLKGIHLTHKHRKKKVKTRLRLMWYKFQNKQLVVTRTFHRLSDLLENKGRYNYVLLTPVFEGISRKSHSGGFNEHVLKKILRETEYQVFAMGGVDHTRIHKLRDLGFDGACLLGAIWKQKEDKAEAYKKALSTANRFHTTPLYRETVV